MWSNNTVISKEVAVTFKSPPTIYMYKAPVTWPHFNDLYLHIGFVKSQKGLSAYS